MSYIITSLILVISLLHFYIMILEMFLWNTPRVRKIFGTTEEFAEKTRVLAANQGLYNGFLAIGLSISLVFLWIAENIFIGQIFAEIFLAFISIAGIYGGISSNKKIFFIQGVPSLICMILIYTTMY